MKKNAFICSALMIFLCLCLSVGTAFALFTGKDTSDAVITAGNVDVAVTAENLRLSSTLGENLPETAVTYTDHQLVLERIVAGDVVEFDLRIHNNSNVTIKFRTLLKLASDEGLWQGLEVTLGNVPCLGSEKVSAWELLAPDCEDIIVPVKIHLPENAAEDYNGKGCRFSYCVEAVQGNANVHGRKVADGLYYEEAEHTYRVENANGLLYLGAMSVDGENFAEQKVELLCDIDLDGAVWTPIASFAGEWNGNGKTISNFCIQVDETQNGGFFDTIEAGTGERVHDLTLKNVTATVGNGRFGTLANTVYGVVNRVTVENVEVTTTDEQAWVGGMCAFVYWGWLNDCTVNDLVVHGQNGGAIVAGFAPVIMQNDNYAFENCCVNGFEATVQSTIGSQIAGFAGQTQRGGDYPKLVDCHVTDLKIVAGGYLCVGGFIANPGAQTTMENCSAQGVIDATAITNGYAGGFLADLGWNDDVGNRGGHQVISCVANVDISTENAAIGGFIGSATNSRGNDMPATFIDCVVDGSVNATGAAHIGGFAGEADRGTYRHCRVNGMVNDEKADANNFIGFLLEGADITIKAE